MTFGKTFRSLLLAVVGAVVASLGIWATADGPGANASTDTTPESRIVAAARGLVDVEGGMVRISSRCDGTVLAVGVEDGAKVKSGDVLAKIDDKTEILAESVASFKLDEADAHLEALELKKKALSRQLNRLRRAAAGKAVSTQDVDEAQDALTELLLTIDKASSEVAIAQSQLNMATRALQLCTIRSPIDGIVVHRGVRAGEVASPQLTPEMFTLLPDAPKIVRAEIAENFLNAVAVGMPVEVTPEYDVALSLRGKIARISPIVRQSNGTTRHDLRTATVIVTLDENTPLRVGQRAIVKVVRLSPDSPSMK